MATRRNRRLAEQRRAQSEKLEAVGRLAGGMAHDFNNLLSVILGHGERLLSALGPEHPERARVEQIIRSGRKAGDLTRQLLAFSRRQVLEPRVIRLDEVAQGARETLASLLGEDIELAVVSPPQLASVRADPNQMLQVLLNLVLNARDAMPRGGRLTIEFSEVTLDARFAATHAPQQPGDYVLMAVTDTGEGMDAETQSQVFEPYFTTKPVGPGTGLGLATVYGIVKQSEGFVWVDSEPGIGTSVKVYLPRLEPIVAGASATPLPPPPLPRAPAERSHVLLVEDDDDVRELMADILESQGYRVSSASRAAEALELAASCEPFDLLVTDVIMPGMGGCELARRLVEQQPGLRVLYVSGYAGEALALSGGIERREGFLQKPFSERALLTCVADALRDPA